jgi:hypothetical protein
MAIGEINARCRYLHFQVYGPAESDSHSSTGPSIELSIFLLIHLLHAFWSVHFAAPV